MKLWKKIDQSHSLKFINDDDYCIFAREFKMYQGNEGGDTESHINNFKKDGQRKNKPEWKWRNLSVKKFASEVSKKLSSEKKYIVTAIPSSKIKSDPLYTPKFEDMFSELQALKPLVEAVWPISIKKSVTGAHAGGTRVPSEIMSNYIWNGFPGGAPSQILVFDDVVTTGSQFRSFSDFMRENGYQGRIIGIFWARAVAPSPSFDVIEN